MKKILSLALVLVMVAALFAGCGASASDQEKLVGTWKGEMDMTEALKGQLGEEMEGLELDKFAVTAVFTFTEDGTYTMELDKASVEKAFEDLVASMEGFMKNMMEEQAKEAGMTLDDLLAAAGMTMDDMMTLVTDMLDEMDLVDTMVEESKGEGKFKAADGKLYLSDGLEYEVDEKVYDTYTLDGDVLTLTATYGADDEEADMMKSVYPIVLKKAS